MTTNINAKKRLTQLLVAFVILCMTVTGVAFLLKDGVQKASAATRTVSIGSAGDWNTFAATYSSGDIINATLTRDIVITGIDKPSETLAPIPAGVTVNLNMSMHSIYWDTEGSGGDYWKIMSTQYPLAETFWGLIKNNGTLNLTGEGTVRMKKICYDQRNGAKQTDYGSKTCAILNNGTLTIGASVTVESYTAMAHTSSSTGSYSDQFIYACAVYNNGKVNSLGTINAGAFSGTSSVTAANSYHYAFSYGIYGGEVNVTGGKISSIARSGALDISATAKEANHIVSIGVGVFSNNAKILGNTSIETETFTWACNGDYSSWQSGGIDVSYSAGVMYTSKNYPTIGAGTNITSKFVCAGDGDKIFAAIPGSSNLGYSVHNKKGPSDYARRAYPVVGVAQNLNTIGTHGSEKTWSSDNGFFGSNSSQMGSGDVERVFGFSSTKYRAEDPYYDNLSEDANLVDCTNLYRRQSGQNTRETVVSKIVNGVPSSGENGQLAPGVSSAPAAGGSQYVIVYRYYDNNMSAANFNSVSYQYDSSKQNSRASVVIDNQNVTNGLLPGNQKITAVNGGTSKNEYYYEFVGTRFEKVDTEQYVNRFINSDKDQMRTIWGTTGSTLPSGGLTPSANQTVVLYMNYLLKSPRSVRVAAANKGVAISGLTDTTSFTVPYTGKVLVPGTDFNIGIIDMGADTELSINDMTDDKVVTEVYNIRGNGSTSGNDATAVVYRYTTDATPTASSNWIQGLPKDAGKYTIEVRVYADTTFASSGTYNRLGTTQYITCEITKADVTITGDSAKSGTYGNNLATLVPFSSFTVKGANNESVSGTWSFDQGFKTEDYVNAGSYNLNLVWTPTPGSASEKNYNPTLYSVTLVVNKRAVTVNVGTAKAGYGDKSVKYTLEFENLAACDNKKVDGWEKATTGEINYNNAWVAYSEGVPMGTYPARIVSFGGASDTNNTFTYNTHNGTLEVGKKILYYSATATDRAYIPNNYNVDVKLTYKEGAIASDTVPQEITNVVGTMTNPNAGENKNVQVDVSKLQSAVGDNYQIVIDNATSLTVDIAKAIPAGVACAADPGETTYDSTKTLANTALKATSQNVAGSWNWKDESIVPTCDVSSYTAVFTPADIQNYESIEQAVSLNVKQKDVLITIPALTITYGDPQPALAGRLTYTGFTGEDNRSNVATTGEVNATTTYTRGTSGVGVYAIEIRSDLASTNYNFITQDSTLTVNKKALTITAVDQSVTYGEDAPELGVNDVVATGFYGRDSLTSGALTGNLVVSTTYKITDPVGEYDITVTGCEADNYAITYQIGTLTVNKAVLTVKPNAHTVSYGAPKPGYRENMMYTISGFVGDDTAADAEINGAPDFNTSYKAGNSVGNYTVTPDVSQLEAANYSFTFETNTLVVEKATPIYGANPSATIIHDQAYSEAAINGVTMTNPNNSGAVDGEFALAQSSEIADITKGDTLTDIDFIFTPSDDVNYNSVTLQGSLVVTPKNITGKPIIKGSVMVGQELTADVSAMDPADAFVYTYQWYYGDTAIPDATEQTYKIAGAYKDQELHVEVSANWRFGYTGTKTSDPTSRVIEALTPASTEQLTINVPKDCTYDKAVKEATVKVAEEYKDYVGEVTVKYNGSAEAPMSAGTYIVTVDIAAPDLADVVDKTNYFGPVSGLEIGRFTIAKAPVTITVNAENKVYDGTRTVPIPKDEMGIEKDILVMRGVIENDDVKIASGYKMSFANANVGDDKIINFSGLALTGAGAENYTIILENNTASINPAVLTAKANGVTKVYDGSPVVDVKFTNISGYVGGDSDATVYPVNGKAHAESVNAGTGLQMSNVSYELRGSSAGNYVLDLDIGTVDITPATPDVVAPEINGLIYDSTRTLANVDLSAYRTSAGYWGFVDLDTVPHCSTTRYAATYYPSSNNYSPVTTDITINLIPKTVVIRADNKTVQYGQKAPSFTYTVQGLTGQDRLEDIGGAGVVATTVYREGQPVGDYKIILNAHFDSDDYTFVPYDGMLTVSKARLVVEAKAVDREYNGGTDVKVNFTIVSGKYGNDDVKLSYYTATGYAATANAGVSPVRYDAPVLNSHTENYELYVTPASNVLTVNIMKADLDNVIFPTEGTIQFGYDLSNVKFATEGFGDGIFAYENAKGTIPDKVGVYANYKVIFTPTDSRNYNTQEAFVPLTVVKGRLDYVVSIAGTPQEGQTLSAYITGMPSLAHNYIHYQWYRVSDTGVATKIEDATESAYVATSDDIGYTLIVITYFASDAPYVFADSADVISDGYGIEVGGIMGQTSSAIEAIKLSFWQRLMNWIYRLIAAITGVRFSGFGL